MSPALSLSLLIEAARKLACPAVILTTRSKGEDFAMISTTAYANLEPLMLSTTLARGGRTAGAILEQKRALVSVLSEKHQEAIERLATAKKQPESESKSKSESESESESDSLSKSASPLEQAGFKTNRAKTSEMEDGPGILYVCDALTVFDLSIVQTIELDNHFLAIGMVVGVPLFNKDQAERPLIRYNRRWSTVDPRLSNRNSAEQFEVSRDNYPV